VVNDSFEAAQGWLSAARRVVVLTGAGISTASGIPDFRGPDGIWTKDPAAEARTTMVRYLSDPELRQAAWRQRASQWDTRPAPNAGHRSLLGMTCRGQLELLVTQNIDGLHRDAGIPPELLVEIHGSTRESVCLSCGHRQPIELTVSRVRDGDDDPRCIQLVPNLPCGGILKSGAISFGQSINAADLMRCERAADTCDLLLCVGSTLGVYPIASIVPRAKRAGAVVVIVNGQRTEMDDLADALVGGDINERLPALLSG
jgi:NAD-dependent deacetylase